MLFQVKSKLRTYFITGLLTIIPVMVTVYVINLIIKLLNSILSRPFTRLLEYNIPGIEVIVFLAGIGIAIVIIIMAGIFTTNILGQKLIAFIEELLAKVPLISSIYNSVKQLLAAVWQNKTSFSRVVLVEYPKEGIYSVGFVTSESNPLFTQVVSEKELVSVYIPTTPNPTSGMVIIFPKDEVIPLKMTPEEASTFIISGGIVGPKGKNQKQEK
ncbi:MAG: DUF502 domain-containing protein [bacterium]